MVRVVHVVRMVPMVRVMGGMVRVMGVMGVMGVCETKVGPCVGREMTIGINCGDDFYNNNINAMCMLFENSLFITHLDK